MPCMIVWKSKEENCYTLYAAELLVSLRILVILITIKSFKNLVGISLRVLFPVLVQIPQYMNKAK